MPTKRNRDDEEEKNEGSDRGDKSQSQGKGSSVVIKTESRFPPTQAKSPDDCEDKVELKKWVKELLARNPDLESENKKLHVDREEDQKLLEKKRIAAVCCRCYSWCHPEAILSSLLVFQFYPNPNLVGVVEEDPNRFENFLVPFITCPYEYHMYGLEVESYSQMMKAFTEGLVDEQKDDVVRFEQFDSTRQVSFFLCLIRDDQEWDSGKFVVAGGIGRLNPLFGKALENMESYKKAKENYSDDLFCRSLSTFTPAAVVYEDKDELGDSDSWRGFPCRSDPVNVCMRSAKDYKSKVKSYVPSKVSDDRLATKAVFDLDRMKVEGDFGSLPFCFSPAGYDDDSNSDA